MTIPLLSISCGLIVANLYYAQPLIDLISKDINLKTSTAGLIVTMTQIGYVIGLIFIVPLSDLMENKKIMITTLALALIGLLIITISHQSLLLLFGSAILGIGSVTAQIIVPYGASMSEANERGKTVGTIMSGLFLGILFSRPLSSLIATFNSWRLVYALSALIILTVIILIFTLLPKRQVNTQLSYSKVIRSLGQILIHTPILRRRAIYQAALFGSFSIFWTVTPLWLKDHYNLTQGQITLFTLLGVGGAIGSPIAGRLADKGYTRALTGVAIVLVSLSFLITHMGSTGNISLIMFCISAVLLDTFVSFNLVLGQQQIYSLGDELRGRLNGLFMALFFIGGAIGSAIGTWAYTKGQWNLSSTIAITVLIITIVYYSTEYLPKKH